MNKPTSQISFNKKAIQHMTAEQFIAHFQPVYPDADLQAYAKELGLISEPVAEEAPAAPPEDDSNVDEDTATSSKTTKPKGGKK